MKKINKYKYCKSHKKPLPFNSGYYHHFNKIVARGFSEQGLQLSLLGRTLISKDIKEDEYSRAHFSKAVFGSQETPWT